MTVPTSQGFTSPLRPAHPMTVRVGEVGARENVIMPDVLVQMAYSRFTTVLFTRVKISGDSY